MSRSEWSVSSPGSLEKAKEDVAVEESTLKTVGEDFRLTDGGPKLTHVLGSETPDTVCHRTSFGCHNRVLIVFFHRDEYSLPDRFGPRKIQAAVQKISELRTQQLQSHCLISDISTPSTNGKSQTLRPLRVSSGTKQTSRLKSLVTRQAKIHRRQPYLMVNQWSLMALM